MLMSEDTQDILFTNQHQLFLVTLHFFGGVLFVQDMLAGLEGGLHKGLFFDLLLRVLVLDQAPCPHGEDFSFHRFLLRGVRNDNTAGALLLRLSGPDQYPIVQRCEFHRAPPFIHARTLPIPTRVATYLYRRSLQRYIILLDCRTHCAHCGLSDSTICPCVSNRKECVLCVKGIAGGSSSY